MISNKNSVRIKPAAHPQFPAETAAGLLGDSMAGSVWTAISRLTGLAKSMTIAAVLGATYLGNTYQAINSLPNLVFYQLLAGSLFGSLLVPALVPFADGGDRARAREVAGGFLGSLLLVGFAMSALLLAVGPLVLRLLTLGVSSAAAATTQARTGWLLLIMFLPQILLYVVAGTGAAVMNAHRRFALPAAAPALESVGIIAVLVAAAAVFGPATDLAHLSGGRLLLLGLGTTGAVGLHAGCQWWGARRCGVPMRPRIAWADPEVRRLLRSIMQTLGFTGLAALQILAVLVTTNRTPGGLVAFQLALNFFYLPTAIITWPVARAVLPRLSRAHMAMDAEAFRQELGRAVSLASFITIPIALAYVTLCYPIARAVAFGELGTATGERLVAASLAAVAMGIVGETWFILGTYASYARRDARSPVRSMAVRVGVSICLILAGWFARGPSVLIIVGLSLSVGSLAGALHMGMPLRAGGGRLEWVPRSLARTTAASVLMAVPAYFAALSFGWLARTQWAQMGAVATGAVVGLLAFLGVQMAWKAPEIQWMKTALAGKRSRQLSGRER